jgi:hypothetical protein
MTVSIRLPSTDAEACRYHGRARMAFTCVEWLMSGQPYAWRLPAVPAGDRVGGSDADGSFGELTELLPRAWWPTSR